MILPLVTRTAYNFTFLIVKIKHTDCVDGFDGNFNFTFLIVKIIPRLENRPDVYHYVLHIPYR